MQGESKFDSIILSSNKEENKETNYIGVEEGELIVDIGTTRSMEVGSSKVVETNYYFDGDV